MVGEKMTEGMRMMSKVCSFITKYIVTPPMIITVLDEVTYVVFVVLFIWFPSIYLYMLCLSCSFTFLFQLFTCHIY